MAAESLLRTLDAMADLDLIHARARLSIEYRMSAPHFNEERRLVLRGARHPLLEALFRSDPTVTAELPRPADDGTAAAASTNVGPHLESPPAFAGLPIADVQANPPEPVPKIVTPIDVNLGVRFRILVVTGPNTGGKTVALKTVGVLAIMAQAGLHVPAAEGSQFPIFDDVLADIGDEQSLQQSLSTFSSHVGRIREILAKATPRSLVLLDELGAGTDPTDGAALGRAILDELDRIGCSAIVTTHIGDLKTYALSNPAAENAAVEFDDETFRPKYRLLIGNIGESNALKIARHLQFPEHVVARAEAYLRKARREERPTGRVFCVSGKKPSEPMRQRSRRRRKPSGRVKPCQSVWRSCKRSHSGPIQSPSPALVCSRVIGWLCRGSATIDRAASSSSTLARNQPSWRLATSRGMSRSTS